LHNFDQETREAENMLEKGLQFENLWYGTDFGIGSFEVTERI
jgi:hypothetical protein